MYTNSSFCMLGAEFWALVKLVSEKLGYTERNRGTVRIFTEDDVFSVCKNLETSISDEYIHAVSDYSRLRAEKLNEIVRPNLMSGEKAKAIFERLYDFYQRNGYSCKLPKNKQSGTMKQINFI